MKFECQFQVPKTLKKFEQFLQETNYDDVRISNSNMFKKIYKRK